jgi:hypothetical protein
VPRPQRAGYRHHPQQPGHSAACGLVFDQVQEARADHLAQHGGGQRIGLAVVVNVDVEPVHHIEVRIGKKLLDGGVANIRGHATAP